MKRVVERIGNGCCSEQGGLEGRVVILGNRGKIDRKRQLVSEGDSLVGAW